MLLTCVFGCVDTVVDGQVGGSYEHTDIVSNSGKLRASIWLTGRLITEYGRSEIDSRPVISKLANMAEKLVLKEDVRMMPCSTWRRRLTLRLRSV